MEMTNEKHILKAFGKHLRVLRHSKDFSQESLAMASGVAISSISRIERGLLNPTLTVLMKIQSALDIDRQKLMDF